MGETYDSCFKDLSSALEECRAESVGIYLSTDPKVLEIFGHTSAAAQQDIIYANWLSMCRAGVLGLEFYSVDGAVWRQAHMRARWAILRVLLKAGIVKVEYTNQEKNDLLITLNREEIITKGMQAMSFFLREMQFYKSTGDCVRGSKWFKEWTSVESAEFLQWREIVISKKLPRKVYVQPHTYLKQNSDSETPQVEFIDYEASHAALVRSMVIRFGSQFN